MEAVFSWVATYGYVAIFSLLVLGIVGLPIPDETLMVFCGYLVSQGKLHPVGAFLCALAGSWCGITLSYVIGRTFGLAAVHRFGRYIHLTDDRLAKVHQWFDRIGHWALLIGYFIAGVRHLTAIVAGTSKLEFKSFVAYAWPGGALWVSVFLGLGYVVGENWQEMAAQAHRFILWGSVGLGVAVAIYLVVRRRRAAAAAARLSP